MTASLIATNFLAALLLPPLNMIALCALGMLIRRSYPRLGLSISAAALVVLFVACTVAGSRIFVSPIENQIAPLSANEHSGTQAIVILAGGRLSNAPEYGGADVTNAWTLPRMRYGARLHRETGLPILVTGGSTSGERVSEAAIMAGVLREDFGVPVKWIEEGSDTTAQNASFSAKVLLPLGIRRIILVTDALHMPRSRRIFERNGFDVVSAPTVFLGQERLTPLHYLPSGEGLRRTHYAWHEGIGMVWYRLRHGPDSSGRS
ncbi:MAG: hypothetical protein V7606_425 [Burkholderiales bacterium]